MIYNRVARNGGLAMWWRVIAFVYALGYLWAFFDAARDETAFRLITTAVLLPALVSLFLLAFNTHLLPKLFWRIYAIVFVAYWAVPLVLGAKTLINASGILTYAIIIAVCVVFTLPVVRSLWWLSFAHTEPGSEHLGDPAAR
ncbi:hypothetical protein [Bradyrhizobium sp. B120]|uniref:hypothetical protein n=1 Tax=Bradyrhizobium sp. B120 TaxID=3410088 RepID=UPI003B97E16A